jgi:hypothetical protein
VFRESFAHCYEDWVAQGVDFDTVMSRTTIPYSAYWSFGEDLPALTENHRDPTYVSYPLATVAALLVHRLDKTEVLAASLDSFVDTAMRAGYRRDGFVHDVVISSTPETQNSANELTQLLSQAGLRVADLTTMQLGQRWDDQITRLLDGSQHVVLLLGDKPSTWQERQATYVLRQSIDDATERHVLPIVTSEQSRQSMPSVLRSLASYDLQSGSLADAARLISRISVESRPGR